MLKIGTLMLSREDVTTYSV